MTNLTRSQPTTEAPFGLDDPRSAFARSVALATAVIAQVVPDQLTAPTPCPDMDVRVLLAHLVMVLRRVAASGRGLAPEAWPDVDMSLADDAWLPAWTAAAHEIPPAWSADEVLDRDVRLPWTTMSGADMLRTYTSEVTVHTWDLARATGQQPVWDPDVVAVSFVAIRQALPAEARIESFEALRATLPSDFPWRAPFAAAVDVPADVPLIDRLVAWCGRTP